MLADAEPHSATFGGNLAPASLPLQEVMSPHSLSQAHHLPWESLASPQAPGGSSNLFPRVVYAKGSQAPPQLAVVQTPRERGPPTVIQKGCLWAPCSQPAVPEGPRDTIVAGPALSLSFSLSLGESWFQTMLHSLCFS